MHARRSARDAYFPSRSDDTFFAPRGDVSLRHGADAHAFTDRVNARDASGGGLRGGAPPLRASELSAMVLVHEIFHAVIGLYREAHPDVFARLLESDAQEDPHASYAPQHDPHSRQARDACLAFLREFPTPAIYGSFRGDPERVHESPEKTLARLAPSGRTGVDEYAEELLLLWLANQNPGYEPVRPLVTDVALGERYRAFMAHAQDFFERAPRFGPRHLSLLDLLLEPSREAPASVLDQLHFIERTWGHELGLDHHPVWRRMQWGRDLAVEEGKFFQKGGPGPGAPILESMRFGHPGSEPERFSPDLDWMPRVVLLAKTAFVWLDQLSRRYRRSITRLDQIPDEELDVIASRGFTGLWLIGVFERSRASQRIKQMRGDSDAVASAYSLMRYDIAAELGGHQAYEDLAARAWRRGIRLAADMVPNHVGIDADWVMRHPDWFVQAPHPPFPAYRFGGPDLSDDPRAGVFIDEGYWDNSDAAVVFRRHDRQTGEDRFLYHGNDGTSMPWNDTAQLDYSKAEVRQAVIETILHVARMFPIIRFDAAMTLAKRHVQRLWFPLPGQGGAIPSRSDYAMTQDELDRAMPVEFWREVVDTVAQRAPNTLLLAEAFWMLEGYFVRSLGMHRVYNSAFMNMLKREENDKYLDTIKNVLDFDPEILKRFVNFMSNPDEETAIAQFGHDDRYFGVCVMMATMPGLPMFGHGQVEGLHEKYGMEYRRAKWEEPENRGLVARHEREIFPILKKRYLFSGVAEFALFDFHSDGGGVDGDVFAYTNGHGSERALVLFNNRFKNTRGRIRASFPSRRGGAGHGPSIRAITTALGLDGARSQGHDFVTFRDMAKGLEYVRPLEAIEELGFAWDLGAFEYHVIHEVRAVTDGERTPYAELASVLGDRGVPSIKNALLELALRPVHDPLAHAVSAGHLGYLLDAWDEASAAPTAEALAALDEKLEHVADGIAYKLGLDRAAVPRTDALAAARARYVAVMAMAHAPSRYAGACDLAHELELLAAWLHVEAVLDLLAAAESPVHEEEPAFEVDRGALIVEWELSVLLDRALHRDASEVPAQDRASLLLLAAMLPRGPLSESVVAALHDARGRAYLRVHEAGGQIWFRKESLDALGAFLVLRDTVEGRVSAALGARQAAFVASVASTEGYRAHGVAVALASGLALPTEQHPGDRAPADGED